MVRGSRVGGPPEVTISGSTLSAPRQDSFGSLCLLGPCLYHHGAVSLDKNPKTLTGLYPTPTWEEK